MRWDEDREGFGSLYNSRQQSLTRINRSVHLPDSIDNTRGSSADISTGKCANHPGWDAETCVWCHGVEEVNICSRDKLFEFTTSFRKPGTQIRTKGQWERFKKQNNLVDLPIKERMDMASRGFAEKKRKERTDELRNHIRTEFGKVYSQCVVRKK